ncbi:putative ABC transport system permease protein|uniref:Putative ABC transport system permease protein n=1 Tax=Brenneria salicis ATCC 15712 = DSM 30166 TaxID=714314 RepID=A0A366HWN8_9GAMM|nr:FtsX-like permease family protein [Brenneria salicis]NMN90759.1 putative ABC transport system permease protein [Brenneria salicis ATCC 15712 = DSM 30166]RBP57725.1 putative ABC transport system permease protein [Brenneria salicis ATCC 15712 = DSM 30166]RLM28865.1 hypothetical protein BHG07_16615 [Brenneria salicis ATCC 15712 = DSM 30166]
MTTALLALRNVFRNKRRTLIIFLSIAAAMSAMIVFGGFINYTFERLRESTIRTQLGHIQIASQGYFEQGASQSKELLISAPDKLETTLRNIPNISTISRRLTGSGLITVGHATLSAKLIGVMPERDEEFSNYEIVVEGRQIEQGHSDECVIGGQLAKGLAAKVGDTATILSSSYDDAINAVDCTIVGIVRTPAKEYDKVYVKMNLAHLQQLLDTEKIEYLMLLLDETENLPVVAGKLNKSISGNYEYKIWTQLAEFYQGVVNLYTSIFKLSFIVLSIIVILSITNTMSMSVFERFREIGTLRAMGQTRFSIIKLFVSEGVIIGILGGVIGVLIGTGLSQLINLSGGIAIPAPPGMSSGYTARINLDFYIIFYSFMMSVITATVSSLYPAFIAARKDIVEALTHI